MADPPRSLVGSRNALRLAGRGKPAYDRQTVPGPGQGVSRRRDPVNHLLAASLAARQPTEWPFGPGEMAARIRTHDWAATPLGPIGAWPQGLRVAVDLMLGNGFPATLQWGDQAILLYNDAYVPVIGERHPRALGRSSLDSFPEIREHLLQVFGRVRAGETVVLEDRHFTMQDRKQPRDVWFTLSHSPLHDEAGKVVAIAVTGVETTARVLAERHSRSVMDELRAGEERQAFLLRLSDTLRPLSDAIQIQAEAVRVLGEQLKASRAGYAEDRGDGDHVTVTRNYVKNVPALEGVYRYADYGPELLHALRAGRTVVRPDIDRDPILTADEKRAHAELGLAATVNVPLVKEGRLVAILFVHQDRPRAWTEAEIALMQETAERTWAAVERTRAEAALREAGERLKMLVAELQHRTRNLIGVVQAIADRSLEDSLSLDDFQERFWNRLAALARVNGLLSRLDDNDRISFDELVRCELAGHGVVDAEGHGPQVALDGPRGIRLRSSTVQTLALGLHELATNAIKHGALAKREGRLAVRWSLVTGADGEPWLRVDWQESGASLIAINMKAPRRGAGRDLIEKALPYQLKAKVRYDLSPGGVHCTITLPISTRHREPVDA